VHRAIGVILIIDGVLSMLWVWDKRNLWQIGRMVRIGLGVVLIIT
jgi:hypothetical protein